MMPCMHIKLILIMIKTIKFHDLHRKSKFYGRNEVLNGQINETLGQ